MMASLIYPTKIEFGHGARSTNGHTIQTSSASISRLSCRASYGRRWRPLNRPRFCEIPSGQDRECIHTTSRANTPAPSSRSPSAPLRTWNLSVELRASPRDLEISVGAERQNIVSLSDHTSIRCHRVRDKSRSRKNTLSGSTSLPPS